MSLSAFGNLDSPIPLCIVIFLNVQFCCSSLRVLINMFSSDGSCSAGISSYESDAEMCSCSVDSKEFFEPDLDPLPDSALAASDSDPDPLPDSASFASADSPEDRSKKSIPQELPKNPIRQKRRLRMIDENSDGVRIKVVPFCKQTFRRQMLQTNQLQDDFFLPNRAQLVLNFLKKHGDHLVKEKPGPKKRFASTLHLVQHVLKQK
eukprot:s2381_g4.t1